MLTLLAKNWWVVVLRGVFAILFGLLAVFYPGLALQSFLFLFAVYAVADGLGAVWTAIQNRTQKQWWIHLLEGFVSIIAGIGALLFPGLTTLTVLFLIAGWAIITGVFEIVAAFQLRKEIEGEFWLGLGGLASILFGVLLIVFPGGGILTLLTIVAVYAILFGITLIMLGWKLRIHAS